MVRSLSLSLSLSLSRKRESGQILIQEQRKKQENKLLSNGSSIEVLASLDHFQTVIDIVQEHQQENKKRLDCHKENISQFANGSISLLGEISKIELSKPDIEAFSESMEDYEKKMQRKIRVQKKAGKEGRGNQNKSLLELLQQLDQSNEGRMIFDEIKAMAIDTGTKLSSFLVDYFLLVRQSECTKLEAKIEAVKDVIQSASLEENSVIISKFVSVIEFVSEEMGSRRMKGGKKKYVKKKDDSYVKRGFDLLVMISFQVLNLEIAFRRPFFQTSSAKGQVLREIVKYISLFMAPELEDISSHVKELQIRRRNKLKKELNVGIENLWKELDLQLEN